MNVLCGLVPAELPEDLPTRRRIISVANRRRELFIHMVEDIMGLKEEMERERRIIN